MKTSAYTTKTLYNGAIVPNVIKTDERIFMITTFDGEACLCNLDTAYEIVKKGMVKSLKHFWDWKFVSFGKSRLIEMYESMYPNNL